MMTLKDIGVILDMLEANYGTKFYDGVPKENVIKLWASQFRDDDPKAVLIGVQNCINTMPYKPTIADIRKRMAGNFMQGQMTAMEAFQEISKAVAKAYDKYSATEAYNDLKPILRRIVGAPSFLISWRKVSDESFQTVIMSAIRESYREMAMQEADYHALPKQLQNMESWRVNAPNQEALPEPEKEKTIDEIEAETDTKTAEFREMHGMKPNQEYADGVADFLKPVTKDDVKRVEMNERMKGTWSL